MFLSTERQDRCRRPLRYPCDVRADRPKPESLPVPPTETDVVEPAPPAEPADTWGDFDESGEDEIPRAVLYIIAGLLILAFTLYLVVGGGHNHFH